jgi:hypothetical protein
LYFLLILHKSTFRFAMKLVGHIMAALAATLALSTTAEAGVTTGPCSLKVGVVSGSGCSTWEDCLEADFSPPADSSSSTPIIRIFTKCIPSGGSSTRVVSSNTAASVSYLLTQGHTAIVSSVSGQSEISGQILDSNDNSVCSGTVTVTSGVCLFSDVPPSGNDDTAGGGGGGGGGNDDTPSGGGGGGGGNDDTPSGGGGGGGGASTKSGTAAPVSASHAVVASAIVALGSTLLL